MDKINIIGINGRIGSGKDTVGKIIQQLVAESKYGLVYGVDEKDIADISGWEIKKFAGKLKTIASLLTGIPVDKFEDQELKKMPLGDEWCYHHYSSNKRTYHQMTVREFLQKLGTEAVRDGLHINTWVNALFADWKSTVVADGLAKNYPKWVITDLRFENEYVAVKDRGGVVMQIQRNLSKEGYPTLEKLHPSETALDHLGFDYVIENDGTLCELKEKVRKILIRENII